jgi:hypothetical protein
MPKCTNDATKTYTGAETSPKGLGISASDEEANKILLGKDKNLWIVKENIKQVKRWTRFTIDFNSLIDLDYRIAYFPCVSNEVIENENGKEQKFGGKKPFFIKGEKWPMDNDIPMTFFCQFIDPRSGKNPNMLYRVFLPIDSDDMLEKNWISKIELNDTNLNNQIIIEKPICNKEKTLYDEITTFDAYCIKKYQTKCELYHYEYYKNKFNIPEIKYSEDILYDSYCESKYFPCSSIKIGGTPQSTQDNKTVENYDLIQLTDSKFLPYGWGDAGIGHISEDCKLIWDCC